jgi:cysteinyl-tRNA synthetase
LKQWIFLLSALLLAACEKNEVNTHQSPDVDYRQEMRSFVQNISQYAKSIDRDFIIIPQNGQEIVTQNGESDGSPVPDYLAAIDGAGREDLFYGYNLDDEPTPSDEKGYMVAFCDLCE